MDGQIKILLDLNNNNTVNESKKAVPVEFKTTGTLSPNSDLSKNLNLYQLYNDERDACRAYRLIFTVNPICSNVLFNRISEIVVNEGADNELVVYSDYSGSKMEFDDKTPIINSSSELTKRLLLDDTELTLEDIYSKLTINDGEEVKSVKYHCGLDIFNNHLLRGTSFDLVNKIKTRNEVYNTISDYVRDNNGECKAEDILGSNDASGDPIKTEPHLYGVDTIYSFYESYKNNCTEEDGWYGFNNNTNLDIVNGYTKSDDLSDVVVNRVMNNYEACIRVDMFPDRTLFSSVPKYNKIKNRPEYNWKYVITYPYENDYDKVNDINHNTKGAIECVAANILHTNSGSEMIQFLSRFRHTLKSGDYVNLYYIRTKDFNAVSESKKRYINKNSIVEATKHYKKSQVFSVGDLKGNDRNRYFNVLMKNLDDTLYYDEDYGFILNEDTPSADNALIFFYKKVVSGVECKYYFRKFKELQSSSDERLKYTTNKLSYGLNIYGDRVGQVIFTDDIITDGLVDNLGNEIREVYLTTIKNNASDEYSKCWGKISSGLDMPLLYDDSGYNVIDELKDYNIRCIHNVNKPSYVVSNDKTYEIYNYIYKDGDVTPTPLEDDIEIGDDVCEFYGDVAEFDATNYKESIIEQVYHRVNTTQREDTSGDYRHFIISDIVFDDYDNGIISGCSGFSVTYTDMSQITANEYYMANVNPEGYFYNPFHKVTLLETETEAEINRPKVISFTPENTQNSDEFSILAPVNLGFDANDNIILYFIDSDEYEWAIITNVKKLSSGDYQLTIKYSGDYDIDTDNTRILYPNQAVPTYAIYVGSSNALYWKEVKPLSEVSNDSSLIDVPFSNGRLYFNENVNLYLRRQDPFGDSNLSKRASSTGYYDKLRDYNIMGSKLDLSGILYVDNNIIATCE